MFANGAMDFAVQMAYFLLLFLFPFFLFLVNVAGLVLDDPAATIESLLANAKGFLPPSMINLFTNYLSNTLQNTTVSLFALSAFFTFAAGVSAVQHITRAANSAYGVEDTRPLWARLGIAVLLVFGFALLVATIVFILLKPQVGAYLQQEIGPSGPLAELWSPLSWVIAFLTLTLAFASLYRVAPNASLPFRWVTAGGLITTVFLVIATKIFQLWATMLFRPNDLYGHLGAGIVLMLWLFGIGLVVRFGIEINAQLARLDPEGESAGPAKPP